MLTVRIYFIVIFPLLVCSKADGPVNRTWITVIILLLTFYIKYIFSHVFIFIFDILRTDGIFYIFIIDDDQDK